MKKLLLLTGISVIGFAAFADNHPDPTKIDDSFIQKISPNGKYAVSNLTEEALRIYNLESGDVFSYTVTDEFEPERYYFGLGKCINDQGVFVGGRSDVSPQYWKDGIWYPLDTDGRISFSNAANAISNDGSRICGFLGCGEFSYEEDVLMVEPCIWNAEGDGYGAPVILPYPERDFLGRVPQYVKAIDISGDGKIVIGEIKDAAGRFNYPIIYKEDADGKWSYEIPNEQLLLPEGLVIPENPGEYTGEYPYPSNYMTDDELAAYNEALEKYYNGELNEEPDAADYMSGEEKERYVTIKAEYDEWELKLEAWDEAMDKISEYAPSYQENSARISDDGLTFACTIQKGGGFFWGGPASYNVWVFDLNSDKITKYDQQENLCLTYLANGGIAVSSTPMSMLSAESNSFILKDGEVTGMYEWMNSKVPEYASWMKENMEFEYWAYDEETWDRIKKKEFMTGHATSNPDLTVVALSVQNLGFEDDDAWDDPEFTSILGYGYVFDLNEGSAVRDVRPAAEGKTIYDLSGRQLKEVSSPGIYIINGEKKIVR